MNLTQTYCVPTMSSSEHIIKKIRKKKKRFCGTHYARFLFATRQMRRAYSVHNNIEVIISGMATSAIQILNLHP